MNNLSKNIVIYGQNGAGKTSILEAISLLSSSKGLRSAGHDEIKCFDTSSDQWGVAALLDTYNEQVSVGVGNQPVLLGDQKIAKINGSVVNIGEIEKYLWLLWLTPQTDKIFAEQAGVKRKFFDHLIKGLEPEYRQQCLRYRKAINERMKMLQGNFCDNAWLEAIEHTIAGISSRIAESRIRYCEKFNEVSAQYPINFPKITLSVIQDTEFQPDKYADKLIEKFSANRDKDRTSGITSIGPHRDNWNVSFKDNPLYAENYSTGEQKILLISAILVTSRLYINHRAGIPILLFDDTVAHLDDNNCRLFFEEIFDTGIQTWSASTEKPLLKTPCQYINTKSGICVQE